MPDVVKRKEVFGTLNYNRKTDKVTIEPNKKYGGIRLPEFLDNEDALFGFLGPKPKPAGAGGEVVKRGKIVLKEEMGYVDKLIGWIGRHKALSALGIASLFGLGLYATNDTVKDKTDKTAKDIYDKYFSKFGGKAVVGAPAVVVPAANETVVPTATPEPDYDYYDEEFKVGIVIEGDQQFKQNVTEMFRTMKEIAPNRYKEVIPYAAKKSLETQEIITITGHKEMKLDWKEQQKHMVEVIIKQVKYMLLQSFILKREELN